MIQLNEKIQSKPEECNKRIDYFDIAKGIAILLVIIGHNVSGRLQTIIFSFHMPLFFIISGYFFKIKNEKTILNNSFKRLIIPYLITGMCIIIILFIKNILTYDIIQVLSTTKNVFLQIIWGAGFDSNNLWQIKGIGAIWFLLALFWANQFLNFALKQKYSTIYVIIIAYIGYKTSKMQWLPFSIQPGMTATIFLYIGYKIKQLNILEKPLSYIPQICIVLIWIFGAYYGKTLGMVTNIYPEGLYSILTAICGSYLILNLSKFIEKHIKFLSNILRFIGKNSLTILCIHLIDLKCMEWGLIYSKLISTNIKITIVHIIMISLKILFALFFSYIIVKVKLIIKERKLIKGDT